FLQSDLEDERGGFPAPVSLLSLVWLGFSLAEVGRFYDGAAVAQRAVERAETLSHPYSVYHAYWVRAVIHLAKGEHGRGADAASRIYRAYTDISAFSDNALGLLAQAHSLAGRSAEAIELLERVTRTQARRASFTDHRDSISLGEAYLRKR